jgi:hypothetical protein
MPIVASNIVIAPPPPKVEVNRTVVSSLSEIREQARLLAESLPKPKIRHTSDKLIEYKSSSFLSDMLSDHKE